MQQKPVIFLAFANDEAKYLRYLTTEAQTLRQTLSMAKQHGLCDFEERFNISVRDIFQAVKMSEISIFHYAGHADDQTMSLSQPNSENIWIDTSYLNDFLARNKAIKMIFLNACSSKAQAEALIAKGIPIVIGTSTQISDSIATQLAASFYESLISGHSIGEAWKDATDEILTNNSSEKDIWKKVESIAEEEVRGRVDKKGMKIRVPWKMYYTDEKNLDWKLEKVVNESFNVPNIVIQGCNLSTITVNQMDLQQLEKTLQKIIHSTARPLHLLIVTTTVKSIENEQIKNLDFAHLKPYYSEKHEDWKPYSKEDSILKLLKDYQDKSGYHLNAFILDFQHEIVDSLFIDTLKNMKNNMVLVLDSLSLHFVGNQELARIFNDKDIGGCLLPICQTHTAQNKEIMFYYSRTIFSSLHNFHTKYADVFLEQRQDNGYFYIDLEIADKNTLFRRLTSIARLKFNLNHVIPAFDDFPAVQLSLNS